MENFYREGNLLVNVMIWKNVAIDGNSFYSYFHRRNYDAIKPQILNLPF